MGGSAISCLESCFGALPDPRAANASHRLGDLIVIMVAASLCGAATAMFAETRQAVLARLISYDRAPSHDTFSRLMRLLDPEAFARAFAAFAQGFARALAASRGEAGGQNGSQSGNEVVALDGKALRRAYEAGQAASPPLTVSAFASQSRLCLAAAAPGAGPAAENEVEAALKVVELLDLTDKIVTADALHCHRRMAEQLTEGGAQYMLALKGNRRHWCAAAAQAFAAAVPERAERAETGHGRREWRQAEVVAASQPLMRGHKAFVRLTSRRDEAEPVTRLFMASRLFTPAQALAITRAHWQVENGLHWMLDVHLDEDLSRARKDNAPANTALLKRIARNILQAADTPAVPISHRIRKCAWNDDYLIHAITHMR